LWFFSNKFTDSSSVSLGLGIENVDYQLAGTYSAGQKAGTRGGIYSYSAPGFSLNLNLNFPLVEFELYGNKASIVIDGQYTYGIASVSFNSDFSIPQLQGSSYSVSSHLYDAKALFKYRFIKNQYGLSPFLGLGYLLYEVLPDLNPISGGTFNGQLVVGDSNFSGVGLPLGVEFRAFTHLGGRFSLTPYFLMAEISEDIVNASSYEVSGFPPIAMQILLNYEFTRSFSVLLDVHYLKFEGSSSGAWSRLGNDYTDGSMTLQSYSVVSGLKYVF
jgi:outer membrane protein W